MNTQLTVWHILLYNIKFIASEGIIVGKVESFIKLMSRFYYYTKIIRVSLEDTGLALPLAT